MSGIPEPHGGALVNGHSKMDVAGMEEIKVSASIQSEIENIADGIFSPLDGFLGQADFESVISSGKLVNGTTWTIPIVLDLSSADAAKAKNAGSVLLRGPDIAAVLDVAETFAYDKKKMSKGVFGTDDEKHPGVARVNQMADPHDSCHDARGICKSWMEEILQRFKLETLHTLHMKCFKRQLLPHEMAYL